MNADVTVYISTKDRYQSTLPLAISSIISQTVLPKKFILFEDGEKFDIRTDGTYLHLLHLLDEKKIEWEVIFGKGLGQVHNHDTAVNICRTKHLWRLDDDNCAEPNVLEGLLNCIEKDSKIGAVGGLVIDPTQIKYNDDPNIKNDLNHIYDQPNVQWFKSRTSEVISVDHLYSSFLYRKDASKHGYCIKLSPVSHREESIFTIEMKRNGWQILVNKGVTTWHLRNSSGGIRSYTDKALWDHDEDIFKKKMEEWKTNVVDNSKYVVLDCGLGDTWNFLNILPEIKKKYGDKLVIACCYPQVFEGQGVRLASIQEAKDKLNSIEQYNIYRWAGERRWNKSLLEAFIGMYLS